MQAIKKAIKKQKQISFRRFCTDINLNTSTAAAWRKAKAFGDHRRCSSAVNTCGERDAAVAALDAVGAMAHSSLEEVLTPREFEESVAEQARRDLILPELGPPANCATRRDPVSELRVEKLYTNTAPRIDVELSDRLSRPFLWDEFVAALRKLKLGSSQPASQKLRPISLASCVCELFERIIYNRLEWCVEINSVLPTTQFGFRRNKSTADSFAKFSLDIQTALAAELRVGAVFLDIRGAFDSVNSSHLVRILREIGFPVKIDL